MLIRIILVFALLAVVSGHAAEAPRAGTPAAIRALLLDGRNPDAEAAARALLADTERAAGSDALALAPVLEVLVETLIAGGKSRTDEALTVAERARTIRAARLGADDPEQAWALDALVRLHVDRGEYDVALPLAQRSLALREAGKAEEGLVARSLGLVGLTQFYRQDFNTSRALDQRAFDIFERVRGPEHIDTLNALNALGADQMRTGDLLAAQATFKRLIATYTKLYGAEHIKTAAATTNLAIAYKDMGDFATARPLFRRAIELKEKILGPTHRRLAIDLQNLAVLERDLGNFPAAKPLLDRTLAILTTTYGEEHPAVANVHTDLSIVARGIGDLPTARRHAEKALGIDRAVNQTDDADYGADLTGLAAIEVFDGHLDEAERLFAEALGIMEKRMGADHPYVLVTLVNLAGVHQARGVPDKATPLIERIEAIARTKLVPQDPWYLDTVLVRAEHAALTGDGERALRLSLEATRLASEQLLLNLRTLPEADALRYIARRPAGMLVPRGLAAATIDAHAAELWDAAFGSRALVLDELLARREAARGDPRIAAAWEAWSEANRRYARQLVVGYDEPDARAELEAAQAAMRRTESTLAEASSRFDAERRRRALRLPDVTRRLPADTALVAYWRIDATPALGRDGNFKRFRLGAFVLPRAGATPRYVELGDDAVAAQQVATWREHLLAAAAGGAAPDTTRAGSTVRSTLWDPVAAAVGTAKQVLVVPDGAALGVSFAALPVDGAAYLVERSVPIHLLDDERNLAQAPVRGGRGLLAIGGADFDLGAASPESAIAMLRSGPCGALGRARFSALPETTREAQAVASVWRSATRDEALVLTADAATEAAFKRAAHGKRLLHLATHGIATDTCGDGLAATRAIALADAQAPAGSALSVYGLALAGANARASARDADDGVLTAEELATLDLTGTEWAVLSSCDSGRGAIVDGEGLLGLRRALRLAGVGTSVISLWPIDDASTREWMEALYRARFAEGASTAAAVWQTHRGVLAARRARGDSTAPFYWAPFVASGDWR